MKKAKLSLVGAGPGDPELISLKAIKALQSADVVLYDALVNPDLLNYTGKDAIVEYVGKRAGKHSCTQEEINDLIVRFALSHGHVVRLKGGDPFIFGRGYEEADYARCFNIPVEVVPGISSITLPGMYGISLTKRGVNESFWVVTATTRTGDISRDIGLVAKSSATAVILMGLGKVRQIESVYARSGKSYLPAAIITQGSLPSGRALFCSAGTLSRLLEIHQPEAPAIIVIGEAVGDYPEFYEQLKPYQYETTGI